MLIFFILHCIFNFSLHSELNFLRSQDCMCIPYTWKPREWGLREIPGGHQDKCLHWRIPPLLLLWRQPKICDLPLPQGKQDKVILPNGVNKPKHSYPSTLYPKLREKTDTRKVHFKLDIYVYFSGSTYKLNE